MMRKSPSKTYSYPQCTEASKMKHEWKAYGLSHPVQEKRKGRGGRILQSTIHPLQSSVGSLGWPTAELLRGALGERIIRPRWRWDTQAAPTEETSSSGDLSLLGEPIGLMVPEQVLETLLPGQHQSGRGRQRPVNFQDWVPGREEEKVSDWEKGNE